MECEDESLENHVHVEDESEALLQAARHGDTHQVVNILERVFIEEDGESSHSVDINCKGKIKSNFGWTPLHLASYFGHHDVVEELLKRRANVNVINGMGDTPLHRAAFTGRTDVVLLLLNYNADVSIINGEGRTPLQMTDNDDVRKLIQAAETSQQVARNEKLILATTEGDFENVKELLNSAVPPNLNCQDFMGNTPLHCASYRGHKEIAVLLLQNGIDSTIKNNRGLSALELAKNPKMRQLLDVQPLQVVQKTVQRFEGYIMKRSRFLGWRKHWVVLERGILSSFNRRADASSGVKRQFYKYLDNAIISAMTGDDEKFKIEYSDHTTHYFMIVANYSQVNQQRWLNAIRDHCAYSTHYTSQPHMIELDSLDEKYIPLGSMDDSLKNATAHQQVLEQQITSLSSYFNIMQDENVRPGTATTLKMKLGEVVSTSKEVCSALQHSLTLLIQQEEVRHQQLQEEVEKRRVLEDALHVLAREHLALEQSVRVRAHKRSAGFIESGDFEEDIFYDAPLPRVEDEDESSSSEAETDNSSERNRADDEEDGGEELRDKRVVRISDEIQTDGDLTPRTRKKKIKYRSTLPSSMHSRNEFSIWSVVKQSVGKDLSRIAMPVIFNEPLSFLQRIAEYMNYVTILKEAADLDDPVQRMLRVAVFMVTTNASTDGRIGKPFNPLLGETFELVREDLGFKLVCEQVSHHPPISALYAEGFDEDGNTQFTLTMAMELVLKFWGKNIEVKPEGSVTITIPKYNDVYTYPFISSAVHNIIVGTLWIELYGVAELVNHTHGTRCIVNYKPCGWFGRDFNQLEGYVLDANGVKQYLLKGDWTRYVCSVPADQSEVFTLVQSLANKSKTQVSEVELVENGATLHWRVRPRPSSCKDMYMMSEFAMGLNELLDEHLEVICRTDCRYRPDLRALENGDIETAASEKVKLEELQRATRRRMEADEEAWRPRWFLLKEHEHLSCLEWHFTQKYFERDFSDAPDIYQTTN